VKYGDDVIAALICCWVVLDRPAGKRLAPMLPALVAVYAVNVAAIVLVTVALRS